MSAPAMTLESSAPMPTVTLPDRVGWPSGSIAPKPEPVPSPLPTPTASTDCPDQVDPGHNYHDSIALVRDEMKLSDAERALILRGTAERVFFGGRI